MKPSVCLVPLLPGQDPAAERDRAKADRSVAVVLDQFMAQRVRPKLRPSTAEGYQRVARLYVLPSVGRCSIGEVKRTDIARLHHEMRSKPYQANSTLAMLSKFFGWAERHGLRPDGSNPCRHVEKYREGRRERPDRGCSRDDAPSVCARQGMALITGQTTPVGQRRGDPPTPSLRRPRWLLGL